jgi:RNA polymerase-binding transcription factor DksA
MENKETIKTHYEKHELNQFKKPALWKFKFIKREIRDLTRKYYAANAQSKTEHYNKLLQTAKLFNSIKRQRARIYDGTFGICPVNNNLIHRERLMLMFTIWPKYLDLIHSHNINAI